LRRLVVPVLIFAPRIVSRAFWDGRPTGYGRSPRTIILEFRVLVAIFIWDPRYAALKLAQKSGCVLTVCKAGGELVFRWLFRRSHRRGEQAGSGNGSGRVEWALQSLVSFYYKLHMSDYLHLLHSCRPKHPLLFGPKYLM
jgi:hypothetical protein